ncbi:MAG: DUF1573 domain-containing protein [Deltaproteobacteria bacterium]|nr:DUF1573 domain-containing protein [Deltaproteobacteria bacterium]
MNKDRNFSRRIIITVSSLLFYGVMLLGFSSFAGAAPVLNIEKNEYDFGAILEGTIITRDFFIENRGDEPLLIPRVRSNCACAVADYAEKILPGEKGAVTLEFDSKGSSGMVNYKIRGDSNDPNNESFDLTIKGQVDPVLIIEPGRVNLEGSAGENLETEIYITHDKRHPLKVLSAESKKGLISVRLEEVKGAEQNKYKVKITSLKKEKGKFSDYVSLKTDSDIYPDKQIRVKIEIR